MPLLGLARVYWLVHPRGLAQQWPMVQLLGLAPLQALVQTQELVPLLGLARVYWLVQPRGLAQLWPMVQLLGLAPLSWPVLPQMLVLL